MTVAEVLRMLQRDGWQQVAQRASHRQFKHPDKPGRVTVGGQAQR
jgi:predicted RNA binding protein YcfA (HicA-like mRNA interferase family)